MFFLVVVEFMDCFDIDIESSHSPLIGKLPKVDARLLAGRKVPDVGMLACERIHSSALSDNTRSTEDEGC